MEQKLAEWITPFVIALSAVVVRLMFNAERKSFFGIIRSVCIGLFVGAMANMYLMDLEALGHGTRGAIIGVSVILSEDILTALISTARQAREDPVGFFQKIRGLGKTTSGAKTDENKQQGDKVSK